jgi:hypothetical protein
MATAWAAEANSLQVSRKRASPAKANGKRPQQEASAAGEREQFADQIATAAPVEPNVERRETESPSGGAGDSDNMPRVLTWIEEHAAADEPEGAATTSKDDTEETTAGTLEIWARAMNEVRRGLMIDGRVLRCLYSMARSPLNAGVDWDLCLLAFQVEAIAAVEKAQATENAIVAAAKERRWLGDPTQH